MPGFRTYGSNPITVDISQLSGTMNRMRVALGEENFKRLMYRTFKRVAGSAKEIISTDVRKEYPVKDGWVRGAIQSPKVTTGGEYVAKCEIPMRGRKGLEGPGQTFKLDGRAAKGRLKPVLVKKGTRKPLPMRLQNQGGNPPFLTTTKAGQMVMTRRTKMRYPIVRVGGLSLPQMPMNRAETEIQRKLLKTAADRLDHEFGQMMKSI